MAINVWNSNENVPYDPAMTDYESYFLIAVLFFAALGWHFYIH